jgi:hypothetical protein
MGILTTLIRTVFTDERIELAVRVYAEFVGLAQAVLAEGLAYHTATNI